MAIYLLKSMDCMAVLLLFYKLVLEKENMHVFKRFYLLTAVIAAFVIPSIVFTNYVEPTILSNLENVPLSSELAYSHEVSEPVTATDVDMINWSLILWAIYSIGSIGFGFRFLKHLFQIVSRIRKHPKYKHGFTLRILLLEKLPPHTFFNFIFLNKVAYESKQIPEAVLLHEETHAKQKHSLDVLFIELLQVIFWFNPLVYFFKKCIKLNHEFLADSAVLKQNIPTSKYQNTLLSYLSQDNLKKYQSTTLANAINYSSIKKRFKIMKTQTSKKSILIRSLLLLPLLAILLYSFSEIRTVKQDIDTKTQLAKDVNTSIDLLQIYIDEKQQITVNEDVVTLPLLSEKITQLMLSSESQVSSTQGIQVINTGSLNIDFFNKVKLEIEKAGTLVKVVITDTIELFDEEKWQGNSGKIEFIAKDTLVIHTKNGKKIIGISKENEISTIDKKLIININRNGQLLIYNQLIESVELPSFLSNYLSGLAEDQHEMPEKATIRYDALSSKNVIAEVKNTLRKHNIVKLNMEELDFEENTNGQNSASREQIAEYNTLAKNYNSMLSKSQSIQIKMKDVKRLEYIYGLMSAEQKANAEPFPDFPAPPPAPKVMKGETSSIPPPPSPTNGWTVTGVSKRSSRATDGNETTIPPVAPIISTHADGSNYSKELKQSIRDYMQKSEALENAVAAFKNEADDNTEHLWKLYNEAMELYVNYYKIANDENKFVAPVLARTDKNNTLTPTAPPLPPKPNSKNNNDKILINNSSETTIILTKKEAQNLILEPKNGQIISFKLKIPGLPTKHIQGDRLYPKTKELLKSNIIIQIFNIKTTSSNNDISPRILKIK